MNIWITAPFSDTYLLKLGQQAIVQYESWQETDILWRGSELRKRLIDDRVDIFVTEEDVISREVFSDTVDLQLICVCRGTLSNVDIPTATQHGIIVTNTPGRNAVAVAELTIALMISIARHISTGERAVRESKWNNDTYFSLAGVELNGRTVGLVGFGSIAREVAKRLRCFNTRILAYDPYVQSDVATTVGVELTDLETLMSEADFVSVHLPATEETRGLVSADQIARMKTTAYFINTARAATIDEDAIIDALREKRIAGGAFDVYGEEPLPQSNPYLSLENVVLTPHIGGATAETIANHSRMACGDILKYLNGERPIHIVNPEVKPKIVP